MQRDLKALQVAIKQLTRVINTGYHHSIEDNYFNKVIHLLRKSKGSLLGGKV